MNPNLKTKHRPKHGPKHCFGTEAWTEAQTMFRSIPKQCFGINYSMRHRIVKKRGHRIANIASVVCYSVTSSVTSTIAIPAHSYYLYITTAFAFKSPDGGVPWDDLRKISCGCQWMAKVSYDEKQDQKAPIPIALLNDSFGNRRFLKGASLWTPISATWRRRPQSIYRPLDRGMM